MPNNPIRLECYDRIRRAVKERVQAYYKEHPDLIGDPRSLRAIEESVNGLRAVFAILDEYVISKQSDPPNLTRKDKS